MNYFAGAIAVMLGLSSIAAQELPNNLVAKATQSNYQYLLLGPDGTRPWRVIRWDANAAEGHRKTEIYSGTQPFTPEPSEKLEKSLGTQVLKELIGQWVAGVVANGKDIVQKDMNDSYLKTGKPMYSGVTAEEFRAQGVDPANKVSGETF